MLAGLCTTGGSLRSCLLCVPLPADAAAVTACCSARRGGPGACRLRACLAGVPGPSVRGAPAAAVSVTDQNPPDRLTALRSSRCRCRQRAPCKGERRQRGVTVSAPLRFVLSEVGCVFRTPCSTRGSVLGLWAAGGLESCRQADCVLPVFRVYIQGVRLIPPAEGSVSQGGRKRHQAGVVQPQAPSRAHLSCSASGLVPASGTLRAAGATRGGPSQRLRLP